MLLWDILFRGQLGFSISFLEEMWSRNLANLMMSPLKPVEFVLALMIMSLVRLVIGIVRSRCSRSRSSTSISTRWGWCWRRSSQIS